MITHNQVESVINSLDEQIGAWRLIRMRHPEEEALVRRQIDHLLEIMEQLDKWDRERWAA